MVTGLFDCITSDDEYCGNYGRKPVDSEAVKFNLMFSNIVGISTMMVRYSDRIKPHFYHEHLLGEDYELWLRLVMRNNFKMGHIPEFLASYRIHNTQISTTAY